MRSVAGKSSRMQTLSTDTRPLPLAVDASRGRDAMERARTAPWFTCPDRSCGVRRLYRAGAHEPTGILFKNIMASTSSWCWIGSIRLDEKIRGNRRCHTGSRLDDHRRSGRFHRCRGRRRQGRGVFQLARAHARHADRHVREERQNSKAHVGAGSRLVGAGRQTLHPTGSQCAVREKRRSPDVNLRSAAA